jgi:dihydrodipicolinate synthase/N-acetylneuraminate lyase
MGVKGDSAEDQRRRVAARNQRAIQKHKSQHDQAMASSGSVRSKSKSLTSGGTGVGGASTAASTLASTACLSAASQKAAKERELAEKLQLLQRLRERDREVCVQLIINC